MKFQIPQFIEIEDKIFGPLTLKQFVYLAGGGGLSVVFYLLFPWYISMFFIMPIIAFVSALAFYKVNNRPFIVVLENAVMYIINPKLYIWKHETKPAVQIKKEEPSAASSAFIPKLSNSKLKELTWNLDTRESLNPVTRDDVIQ
ncbi:PrgI family protein [Candidatus Parcubacteria bacterium]|nr:PrgI family protein [Candidatus Parcubacteria bacterium]